MARRFCFILFACFLFPVCIAGSYDVVLKSGKIVKGNLLSENDDTIVVQDASGTKMTFKKTLVDLKRTAEVNKPSQTSLPAETSEKKATPAPAHKKPARVFTKEDVAKLHEGESEKEPHSGEEETVTEPDQENEEKIKAPERTEEEWRASVQQLVDDVKEAEESYNYLQGKCQEFKGIMIGKDSIVNEKGESLDIRETTQETCDRAEEAKGNLEQAKKEYRDFQEDARQQMVPPGYVRTDDEYQEKLDNETPPE